MTLHLIALRRRVFVAVAACTLALAGCVLPPAPAPGNAGQPPEGASGYSAKPGWSAERFMVAAANPLATEAGLDAAIEVL